MVYRGESDQEPPMKDKKPGVRDMKAQSASSVRASISFPPDLHETLEEIA
jgi:hypothetical protein